MVIKKVNLDIVIGVTSAIPQTELPEVAFAGKPTWENLHSSMR